MASIFAIRRFTLSDMLDSEKYQWWLSDRLGQNLLLSGDDERFDRIQKAAEIGADGSYHAEVIADWRDFLDTLRSELRLPEKVIDRLHGEIDDVETRHEIAGTLWTEIG